MGAGIGQLRSSSYCLIVQHRLTCVGLLCQPANSQRCIDAPSFVVEVSTELAWHSCVLVLPAWC
jgi:hypothetical protein